MTYNYFNDYLPGKRATMRKNAETFTNNVLYRYPKARNFTASDIIHDMCGDSTEFPPYVSSYLRKIANNETIIEHPTGPKKIVVKNTGQYGRTSRPQHLYKFKEA